MSAEGLSSSQFADACYIPRPSFSQLLNGRNKKISDELITKIHEAFPNLSVLWLMFGEGSMTINSNIEISEAQEAQKLPLEFFQSTNHQTSNLAVNDNYNSTTFSSENFKRDTEIKNNAHTEIPTTNTHTGITQPIKLTTASNKRITNIVVFYDDNSFESFSPTI